MKKMISINVTPIAISFNEIVKSGNQKINAAKTVNSV